MRLTFLIAVLQFLIRTVGYSQVSYSNVQFSPVEPSVGQNVKVSYVPPRTKVLIGRVICLVYFTGPPAEMNGRGFPIVREANMTQRDSIWECEIQGDPNAFGMVAVFADSLGSVDNYDGGGYRNLFLKNGQIIPGASAGLAVLYGRSGGATKYITQNKQLARGLYETDFMKYPQVKRSFIAGYLETFDLLIPTDTLPFSRELEIYAHYPDKTESDLRSLWRFYSSFNKPEQAKAYRDQCFRQFPNGHWAVTHASLLLGIQLPGAKDDSSKVEIYNQYKKRFDHHYENESMRNQMSDRKGDFLSYLIEIYVKGDSLDAWEKETNSMDDYGKCHVYLRTARQLLEASQKKGLINNPALPIQKELDNEHPFLIFPVANDDFRPPLAEQLSRHAVELYRANLNAPRRIQESLYLTDEQIATWRNVMLGMYLDGLGQSLLKQNKFEEAYGVIQEAINRTVYQDQRINEHFIEILVKTNRLQQAIEESRKMMEVGKSTSLIDACYQQLTHENFTIARERTAMLETAKLKLNEQLLNLKAPDFEFVNLEGKSISLKTLKNKTIVLDFWALWCVPCLLSLGPIAHVAQTYGSDNGIVFLFVNVKRDAHEKAAEFLRTKGNNLLFVIDPTNKALVDYGASGIPTRVVIDRHGKVRFRTTGFLIQMSDQEQENELIAMLELVK